MSTLKKVLLESFQSGYPFTLPQAYEVAPEVNKESVRARIYENLGIVFERVSRGVYQVFSNNENCMLLEGDGRDLSFIKENSIDCIITDHPWDDPKSNKGGNRSFANYKCFRYTKEDFMEKARVLKEGSFLVEFIPSETEVNYEYLYQIKTMAKEAGFKYYAKVPWKKGMFVANTGRNSKNTEDVLIFTKGKAKSLRPDAKKNKANPMIKHYMSGAKGMLPTVFDYQPPRKNEMIHGSEKAVGLIEELLHFLTFENETVLDQFAGSGSVGEACINTRRKCILIEESKEFVGKVVDRLKLRKINQFEIAV